LNLTGIVVVAFDPEHQRPHHLMQSSAGGQLVWRMQVEEMAEITPLHLRAAELVEDNVPSHDYRNVTNILSSSHPIQANGFVSLILGWFGIIVG
jgi:hypothetical protein